MSPCHPAAWAVNTGRAKLTEGSRQLWCHPSHDSKALSRVGLWGQCQCFSLGANSSEIALRTDVATQTRSAVSAPVGCAVGATRDWACACPLPALKTSPLCRRTWFGWKWRDLNSLGQGQRRAQTAVQFGGSRTGPIKVSPSPRAIPAGVPRIPGRPARPEGPASSCGDVKAGPVVLGDLWSLWGLVPTFRSQLTCGAVWSPF